MGLSIEPYITPLTTARAKVNANAGGAAQLESSLRSAAGGFSTAESEHTADSQRLQGNWQGQKGTTFEDKTKPVTTQLSSAGADAKAVADTVGDAAAKVAAAGRQIDELISEFRTEGGKIITAATAAMDTASDAAAKSAIERQAQVLLKGMEARYAHAAAQIVNAAKGALSAAGGPSNSGSTAPSSAGGIGGRSSGGSTATSGGGTAPPSTSGGGAEAGGATSTASAGAAQMVPPPSNNYNDGSTKVKLPDGKEVTAPNARAATALRAALSRKGLPYVWGGTDPTKGMDCSGLTQWSYGQAGVKIPRTAKTQTIGKKVDQKDIQPGDLIVWSGHVCMYIGDGQIIEEPQPGETCHIRPVRWNNCGEPLLGVFRPSA